MVTGTGAECPIVPYRLCSGPSSLGAGGILVSLCRLPSLSGDLHACAPPVSRAR